MDFLADLERTRAETLPHFDLPEADLGKSYGDGKWTVRYVLQHLADAEATFFYRIRRVISEPNQVIWATDQDAWARRLDYATVPMDLGKRVYTTMRDAIAHYARRHYEGSEAIALVHSQMGLRTLKDEFDKVVTHNRQHLATIEVALRSTEHFQPWT